VYRRRPPKRETHRALLDVQDSIGELAFYRAEFLARP
jgi:oligoribonuclease (3'-5' exoribonuclease)